jgi:prophage regulatory protein
MSSHPRTISQERTPARLLRLPSVIALTGLSGPTLYRLVSKNEFPKQVKITHRIVGWQADEVEAWLRSRPPGQSETPRPQPRRGPRLPVPAEAAP